MRRSRPTQRSQETREHFLVAADAILHFSVIRRQPGQIALGRIQFLNHCTPNQLLCEDLMEHPNKVVSMTDVAMASADPQDAATRFQRYLGRAPGEYAGGWRFTLGRCSLTIHTADALQATLPGIAIPNLPFIGAYSLGSEDLAATKALLNGNGIESQHTDPNEVRGDPLPALGETMIFTQGDARAPWMEVHF